MLFAGIDIGSNAARLLISNLYEKNNVVVCEKEMFIRVPLRLGMDVFKTQKEISKERCRNLFNTIKAFQLLMDVNQVNAYRACATAAMREAANSKEIVEWLKAETGITVEIINGYEEAAIVAASDGLVMPEKSDYVMFIDVGGGSTEISILHNKTITTTNSFQIGTIRLLNNKTTDEEWERMKQWVKEFRKNNAKILCIGSGGNINKLIKLYGNRETKIITTENLKYALDHLNRFSVQERIDYLGLRPDRADVILPAVEIFNAICKWAKTAYVYVPQIGLADGIVNILYKEYRQKQVS